MSVKPHASRAMIEAALEFDFGAVDWDDQQAVWAAVGMEELRRAMRETAMLFLAAPDVMAKYLRDEFNVPIDLVPDLPFVRLPKEEDPDGNT